MQLTMRITEHSKGTTYEITVTLDASDDPEASAARALAHKRAFEAALGARDASRRPSLTALGSAVLALVDSYPEHDYAELDARWEETGARSVTAYRRALDWLLAHGYLAGDDTVKRYVPIP